MQENLIKFRLPNSVCSQLDNIESRYTIAKETGKKKFLNSGFYLSELDANDFDMTETYQFIGDKLKSAGFRISKDFNLTFITNWPGQTYIRHTDNVFFVHIPVITHADCMMIIEDTLYHLERNCFYILNTKKWHSAFNLSDQPRLHLLLTAEEIN